MNIRYAGRDDFERVWPLLMELHSEQALFPLDYDLLAETLARCIDEGGCLVAEKDGRLIGTFGLVQSGVYYSRQKIFSDCWIYVAKAYRKSTAILRLKRAAKTHIRRAGLPLLAGAVGHSLNGARLFEHDTDFQKIGELYMMRP